MISDFDDSSDLSEAFTGPIIDSISCLSKEDRDEYERLRNSFNIVQSKDRHTATFQQEISKIIAFVNRSPKDREQRAIAAGLLYTGNYFCVNTQQLIKLICRCKSSINNGFHQLGYTTIKIKARVCLCLKNALPSIASNPQLCRQWTVRAYLSGIMAQQFMEINNSKKPLQRPPKGQIFVEYTQPIEALSIPHLNLPSSAPLKKSNTTEFSPKALDRDLSTNFDIFEDNGDDYSFESPDDFNLKFW
ncbi:hypothetical protein GPJ56_008974 [Histomonas meleagridis]|uniref:uncharacterized protein n=1 Tax=Histomonas meleagridis TaxID=135588 RepID=UPI003559C9E3|nr:hypothetical protein GPJ56_008974 [Histomonas meleagridis]KAH0805670.1 hypothetical protein GO595_001511 [Histomonas meleagridis]